MEAERWRRIEELYHSALQVTEEQRPRFLKQACTGDDALREEVESLLTYHKPAQDFIDAPAFEIAAVLSDASQSFTSPIPSETSRQRPSISQDDCRNAPTV